MNIEQTEKILFNPLFTSKLLLMALEGSENKKIKLELIYYILPLVYNDNIRDKLNRSNIRSTFNTFLDSEIKVELITIETLLRNYRKKTKEALIILSNINRIEFSTHIILKSQKTSSYSNEKNPILKEYFKAAYNLGSILSKENHNKIFYTL